MIVHLQRAVLPAIGAGPQPTPLTGRNYGQVLTVDAVETFVACRAETHALLKAACSRTCTRDR